MNYAALIEKLLIFLVLMLVGYISARKGILDRSFTKAASSLVLNVFMTCAILNSVLTVDLSLSAAQLGNVLLTLCVMQLLGYVVAALVARFTPIEAERKPGFELLMAAGNNMFIALPLVDGLFGPVAVFYVSLSCLPFNVLIYTYGVWRMKKSGGKLRIRDIFSIPLLATLLSLLIFLLHIPVPQILRSLISSTAGASMPMSMVVIGASLGTVSLLDAFKNRWLYLVSAVRLLAIPLLTWLVCGLLTSDPILLMTAVVIAGCPSAILVTIFSVQYGRDPVFTAEGTLQNTALSLLTLPLLLWLLG